MLFSIAFGVPEKSVFTRLFCVFASAMLANFQDRLVMTASITLHVYFNLLNSKSDLGKRREQQERTNKNIQL